VISSRQRRLESGAVILLALTVTTIGIVWGTRVAAGSDAYGYISQVDLWLRGDLHIDQRFGANVPWPLARWTFLPLGYRPEPDGYRIVPQYPPGLPLMMAGAKLLAGQCAMFWIVPICGGILVVATYAIGRRVQRPVAGLAAAWIVATSPTLLFMVIAPMSDVPAAAAWAVAIACALGQTRRSAIAGGVAAAIAIMIRPNLVPLAAVLAIWIWWRDRDDGDPKRVALHPLRTARTTTHPARTTTHPARTTTDPVRRATLSGSPLWFALPASIGALAIAVINARLYGSPFKTGYDLTEGFSLAYVWPNLQRYVPWLVSAETPVALAGLLSLFIPAAAIWRTPAARQARPLLAGCAIVVWAIYLLYVPWDAWWYLRFLLPLWPLVAIGTASLVAMLDRSARGTAQAAPYGTVSWRSVAAAGVILALGAHGLVQAVRRETFNAARGEAKYVEVARVVESLTQPNDVIIAAQHSGSVRYYAGRLTVRWDTGDVAWLDRTVEWLAAHGHHPYFVLEPQEIRELRARYGPLNATARLDWTPLVSFRSGNVLMYDAVKREAGGATMAQTELHGVRECPEQRPAPTLR
jgi:hypothetical protein